MKIELRNHPAQARHPVTNAPLFDATGKAVPMFPEQRGIFLDGSFIGYVCDPPARGISLTIPDSRIPFGCRDLILSAVQQEFGAAPKILNVVSEPVNPNKSLEEFDLET